MEKVNLKRFNKCSFGKNVSIKADKVIIGAGAKIGDNVCIAAKEVFIGFDTIIEKDTRIMGLEKPMDSLKLGDNAFIGFGNQILVSRFEMLDYSQLHNSGLHSGYDSLTIGHNCWIGQNSILNATERLEIGDNVRIGTQSQLWTHVASGELLEGCTLFGKSPLILEDNVWLVGGAVISPGLILEKNSIILPGAVLTKSTKAFGTYAGVPAIDITEKMNCWKKLSIDEKYRKIKLFINEFIEKYPDYRDNILIIEKITSAELKRIKSSMNEEQGFLLFVRKVTDWNRFRNTKISVFDLYSKQYQKKRSQAEINWMKYSIGYRARFIPLYKCT
jgi:acetyltransferase-like isoleucine patch superfamily enzyme